MNEQITTSAPANEPAPTPTPVPEPDNRVGVLETQVSQMAEHIQSLTRSLQQALDTPVETPPPPKPEPTGDEYLDRLARQPKETIAETAAETALRVARETMGPGLTQLFDTAGRLVLQEKRNEVDSQFGPGAFEAEFLPSLKQNLDQLRKVNPKAVADPDTVQALIDRIRGQKFDALVTRREAHGKAMADSKQKGLEEIVSAIPGGGGRFTMQKRGPGAELPEDFDQFSRELTAATGTPIDKDEFARLHKAGNTIDDFLAAVKTPA